MSDSYQFDVVVVGGGPAGLAAACAAAESGRAVALVDDTPWLGGQIWRGQEGRPAQGLEWIERFQSCGATVLDNTSVIAIPQAAVLMAEKNGQPCEIRYRKLVLTTGARELFLPFPGWTLPGVMGPGGMQALVKNGWPVRDQRVVLAGSGPLLLAVAGALRQHGAHVVSIAEQAPWSSVLRFAFGLLSHPSKLWQGAQMKAALMGVPYRCGVWPVEAEGGDQVRCVTLTDGRKTWTEECHLFACGFGLVPNVELPLTAGCELKDGFVRVNEWQATSVSGVYCAGEPTGIGGADCALVEGQIAGYAASGQPAPAEALFIQRAVWHKFRVALVEAFALRPEVKRLAGEDTLLCRCEDVTFGRMRRHDNWRDAKLQTRCGMGPCQGRVCGAAAKEVLGWGMESVRPPVLPARIQSLIRKPK